jgi:hypothetical protein
MFCDFIEIEYGRYRCSKCNTEISTDDYQPPVFICGWNDKNIESPDLLTKIKNFSNSLIDHAKNNFNMADDAEIARRFSICKTCDYFRNSSCLKCGCPINRHRNYISKLSWSSEKCPIDKW